MRVLFVCVAVRSVVFAVGESVLWWYVFSLVLLLFVVVSVCVGVVVCWCCCVKLCVRLCVLFVVLACSACVVCYVLISVGVLVLVWCAELF